MSKCTLITGGAGFIGTNYASRLLNRGDQVIIFGDKICRCVSRSGPAPGRPGCSDNIRY